MDCHLLRCAISSSRRVLAAGLVVVATLSGVEAQASIFLPVEPLPTDWSDFAIPKLKSVTNAFNGDGDLVFSMIGSAESLNVGPGVAATYSKFSAPVTLSVVLDPATLEVKFGGFEINWGTGMPPSVSGALPLSYYVPNVLMLKGSIFEAMMLGTENKNFQFAFSVLGGSAAADFGGLYARGVLNFTLNEALPAGGLKSAFGPISHWNSIGTLDITGGSPVPEPGSFIVFAGLGLITFSIAQFCRSEFLRSNDLEPEQCCSHHPRG